MPKPWIADRFAENTAHTAPAYQRIKELLLAEISQGRMQPGQLVPSENELVQALGLSRMTVNRALRELASEGVLVRSRGVGTFVADFIQAPTPLVEIRNIAEDISARGHRHRTEVLSLEEKPVADVAWPAAGDGLEGTIFHSLLVHYENDIPFQLEDRYVNPREAPEYLGQDFTETTPNDYLTKVAPLTRGKHVVEAILASASECTALRIERTQPCLLVRRRTWSERGLVSAARLIHPGSRGRLEGEFGA